MAINKIILIGNLGADPIIRTTHDGKKIASFSLATSEKWKDRNGEKKESTQWHNIVVFNDGLSGVVQNYVKKGSKLYIEGKIQNRMWKDNDNNERYVTEVVLEGFQCVLQILN